MYASNLDTLGHSPYFRSKTIIKKRDLMSMSEDYYKLLGVEKEASRPRLKRPIASRQ